MGIFHRSPHRKTIAILAAISLLLLLIGGSAAWMLSRPRAAGPLPRLTPPPSLSELAAQYPKYADILLDPELDSVYKDFLLAYQEGGVDAAMLLAQERGILTEKGDLRLVLELETEDSAALEAELTARGFRVGASSGNLMDVLIPRAVLEEALQAEDPTALFKDMTALEQVRRVRIPLPSTNEEFPTSGAAAGFANGEGVNIIGAGPWHAANITGRGIKVGILDLGFRGYQAHLGRSLPENIVGRSFILDADDLNATQTEHGAACAEVIHSIAPDAQLFFAAYRTEVEMREAVDWLLAQGVQIISNSTGTAYGPLDGTAAQSRLVDEVSGRGVLWINSAGNFGHSHYRGIFTDTDGNGYHEFPDGQEVMTIAPNTTAALILNWDDWGGGTEDYSLFLLDDNQQELAASRGIQNGPDTDAAEAIVYNFPGGGTYSIAIRAEKITRAAQFDFFIPNARIEFPSAPYSVSTPGDARTALTVGAVFWRDSALEPYSSQGPTHDERTKPDISAPAGVQSEVYQKPFSGTSASAPHVAGAAALVLEANPGFSPADLRDFLSSRSVDLGSAGLDSEYGAGTLWLGDPPGVAAVPTPTDLPAVAAPTATIVAVSGDLPVAKTGVSVIETAGLVCAFGLGLAGLFGFVLAVMLMLVSRPAPTPAGPRPARVPQPPTPWEQQWRQPGRQMQPGHPAAPLIQPARPRPQTDNLNAAVTCPYCGSPGRPTARYCTLCGTRLPRMGQPPLLPNCRRCGRRMRPNSRYCAYCGAPGKTV